MCIRDRHQLALEVEVGAAAFGTEPARRAIEQRRRDGRVDQRVGLTSGGRIEEGIRQREMVAICLLYTSPAVFSIES